MFTVLFYQSVLLCLLCSCSSVSPKSAQPREPQTVPNSVQRDPGSPLPPELDPSRRFTDLRPQSDLAPVPEAAQPSVPQPAPQPPAPVPAPQPKQPEKPKPKPKERASSPPAASTSQNHRLTLSQLVKKYPDRLRLKGPSRSNTVALTFDDAPDNTFTPQVLDILKKYNVRATFFLLGVQATKHPDVVKRIVSEGHVIGNHSYNHKLFTKLSDDVFRDQVLDTQKVLKNLIGYTPKLLRPPYGEISESQLLWASDSGFTVVNWNVDSLDWKQLDASRVTSNILNHTRSGSIILQHSGGGPGQNLGGTVSALPTVIKTLKSRGYKLVTLPELLQVSKQM
ncbi:hypothetical protein PAESOLCIP111_06129 [Paenibacillus solanacearum]|uniref:NodB homology domain-containing protein n=1 Tax=Paenibacillus solanacearum TaxID=2048548 RepID=A0A916K8T7_9BACL|nr:hypothetical protein PAESOLCIP111_06129 [Paenibacillus solanacearum]